MAQRKQGIHKTVISWDDIDGYGGEDWDDRDCEGCGKNVAPLGELCEPCGKKG